MLNAVRPEEGSIGQRMEGVKPTSGKFVKPLQFLICEVTIISLKHQIHHADVAITKAGYGTDVYVYCKCQVYIAFRIVPVYTR